MTVILRALLAALLLSGLACSAAEPAGDGPPPPVSAEFDAYIQLQTALAADDPEAVRSAARSLATSSGGTVKGMAELIAVSAELDRQREIFAQISAARLEAGAVPEGYVRVHCPMAFDNEGADWIQQEGAVRNPYYGAEMLSCGVVQ